MSTMFCLVSRQALANVLPVFMFQPSNVVLFTTPEEKYCADNLEKLFKAKKINVVRNDDLNAYDYVGFKEIVKNELNRFKDDICLNVTGGTKLMALAAYEAFAEKDFRIIYCDTEHKQIISLFPEFDSSPLKTEISIEEYLSAYGYKITEYKNSFFEKDYFDLFEYLEHNQLIESFVSLYFNVRKKLAADTPKFTVISDDKRFLFQKNFDTYSIQFGNKNLKSFKIQSSDFKSGDWLEYYVYFKLKTQQNLSPMLGVKINRSSDVKNELDVIVLKDFRLYIFSCKTGRKDNQFDLYQLESLRNITSGTFGKGIFVTSNQHSQEFLNRARELSINVINILENNFRVL